MSERETSAARPIRRIVIAGGGTAGWMSAALLSKFFGGHYQIELIESDDIGSVGVGEATIPSIKLFNGLLELDERRFLRETGGTFKLGIEFVNWRDTDHTYVHGFGKLGWEISWIHMYQYWIKANSAGTAGPLDLYSVNTVACREGRFTTGQVGSQSDPQRELSYAYHFDAGLYASLLRKEAEGRGVRRTEGKIAEVALIPETGFIRSIRLARGTEVQGDLFIDCTGFRALLAGQMLGAAYEHWNHWLLNDRALAAPCDNAGDLPPYTRATALPCGWQWRIPLQHRIGNGFVYSSQYVSDEGAQDIFVAGAPARLLADPRMIRFEPGRRKTSWIKNCVAVGLSSGFLEPLESTSIHLIQTALLRLINMFPSQDFDQGEIDEYNNQTRQEFERVRDFIIAHYKVTNRIDSPMWRYYRDMTVPDTLRERLEQFARNGRLFKTSEGLFGEGSWVQILIGQGLFPASYDANVDMTPPEKIDSYLAAIRNHVRANVQRMPPAGEYLARYCSLQGNAGLSRRPLA